MGTAAHSWTLLHDTEEGAFRAQVDALGVEHHAPRRHLRHPPRRGDGRPRVAGTELGGVRIDSGDLPTVGGRGARASSTSSAPTGTRITVTSDLDEYAIAALAASPVDAYGVGTSVVTGSGTPTAGMVYKLVARQGADGGWSRRGEGLDRQGIEGRPQGRLPHPRRRAPPRASSSSCRTASSPSTGAPRIPTRARCRCRWSSTASRMPRARQRRACVAARAHHARVREELPVRALALSRSDPAIPTVYADAAAEPIGSAAVRDQAPSDS